MQIMDTCTTYYYLFCFGSSVFGSACFPVWLHRCLDVFSCYYSDLDYLRFCVSSIYEYGYMFEFTYVFVVSCAPATLLRGRLRPLLPSRRRHYPHVAGRLRKRVERPDGELFQGLAPSTPLPVALERARIRAASASCLALRGRRMNRGRSPGLLNGG